jgi:hypothetical protein
MAILSLKLDKLFIVLVPALVVWFEVVGDVRFPSEPDFVQISLSIKPDCAVVIKNGPLRANPKPKRLVLLVNLRHPTMAKISFKLD